MPDAVLVTPVDLDVATRTVWGEARGEPYLGQVAVAWVIRNRATWKPAAWWGSSVAKVCLMHAQFSCWLDSDPNKPKLAALEAGSDEYRGIYEIVRAVMAGEVDDPTFGATHYEVAGTNAAWARGLHPVSIIRHHEFFRRAPWS